MLRLLLLLLLLLPSCSSSPPALLFKVGNYLRLFRGTLHKKFPGLTRLHVTCHPSPDHQHVSTITCHPSPTSITCPLFAHTWPLPCRRNLSNDERRKLVDMGHSQHVTSSVISLLLPGDHLATYSPDHPTTWPLGHLAT